MKYIGLLFILFVLASCLTDTNSNISFQKINGQKVLICDIDKITETRELPLSDVVEKSELIRLQTSPEAYVKHLWLRKSSGKHIFTADTQNMLMMFTEDGKFVRSWKAGRGPWEFIVPQNPEIKGESVFVDDIQRKQMIRYPLDGSESSLVKLVKTTGVNSLIDENRILSVGNSTAASDPFLICLQDFKGDVIQSVKASRHVNLIPPLVQDKVIVQEKDKGLNIHFPANDTLMFYNVDKNVLEPKALFFSQSHLHLNKRFFEERTKTGLKIQDKELTNTVIVVPEYESEKYFFLSVYQYGRDKQLPWYFAKRKMVLVDKKNQDAFYVNFTDDFWGNASFQFQGNTEVWSKNSIIHDYAAITIKEKFSRFLDKNEMDEAIKAKLNKVIEATDAEDNNVLVRYVLK